MNLVKRPRTTRSSFKNVSAKLYFLFVVAFSVLTFFANYKAIYDTENFFETTSFLEPTVSSRKCQCLDCEIDTICGGLWRSNRYHVNERSHGVKVHVVVAHCMSNLTWLSTFLAGNDVASVHITSKCGNPVIGAPTGSIIKRLANVGRCDHSYVNFITEELDQVVGSEETGKSIIVFLKDDISLKNLHQSGRWKTFEELINIASSPGGFACGITPDTVKFGSSELHISSHHDTKTLMKFSMTEYHRNVKGYTEDTRVPFLSSYVTLGEWMDYLNPGSIPEIVEVCYGGVFAVSATNIKRQDDVVWRKMEESLSRGNNIQEGHFAERTWASLLRTPLRPFELKNLRKHADGVYLNADSMHGALFRTMKVYFHVGLQVSASTELLAKSFMENKETLKDDGYSIAVHGKWDGGHHGFPNVDRLASCMWSAEIRSKFPSNGKEASSCPSNVLSDLTEFLYQSVKQSKDVVISNPWLAHPGTADSLAAYLDSGLDAHVVLDYRRYFEWISDRFKSWRDNLRGAVLMPEDKSLAVSSLRYIDFLREHCKRLFSSEYTSDDALSVVSFLSRSTEWIQNGPIPRGRSYLHYFEQKGDVKGLIDETEYTYFVAKQYSSVPRFHNRLTVVNLHDISSPETNFYCDVLPGAKGACEQAARTDGAEKDILLSNTMPGMDPQLVFEEIVLSAYSVGKLRSQYKGGRRLRQQILRWEKMILFALQQNDLSLADFPTECLYPFEVALLLQVSLEYEKELLPEFFESSRGGQNLEQEFGKWKFCSVDTRLVLANEKWNFLFADHLQEESILPDLPKVYVHVGAPKTGSSSIQDTMALDREVLKQDKFFIAVHGQIEVNAGEFIRDNMLVKCDRLAHCLWTKEEQDAVCVGQTDQRCRCPDYLLPTFDKFLKQAIAEKSEVVVSNEWLQHRTSETGLLAALQGWQPEIIIYYRRFFDWMISSHFQWHEDFNYNMVKQLEGKVRRVDFFRMFCGRLFGKSQTSGEAIVDLVDIQEYTYQIWTRFHNLPEYRENIRVVDFHANDVVETFYCDVINAATACKNHKDRTAQSGIRQVRKKSSTDLIDLAIGLHFNTHVRRSSSSLNDFQTTAKQIETRLHLRNITEDSLPKECLSEDEQLQLLNVSLAYEQLLLPKKYLNGGREGIMKMFEEAQANGEFCSIDTLKIIEDPEFRFLTNSKGRV